MDDQKESLDPGQISYPEEAANWSTQEGNIVCQAVKDDLGHARAARAKLIEETTYQLTDLFTIVCARIDIMSEKVTGAFQHDLLAIRNVVKKGMELNQRLLLIARACRRATSS